jgi:hypothetical protein
MENIEAGLITEAELSQELNPTTGHHVGMAGYSVPDFEVEDYFRTAEHEQAAAAAAGEPLTQRCITYMPSLGLAMASGEDEEAD